jgi:hypothetical protein
MQSQFRIGVRAALAGLKAAASSAGHEMVPYFDPPLPEDFDSPPQLPKCKRQEQ